MGGPHGWTKRERLDLRSHLGSVIGAQVNPLPLFGADMREVDGKPIAAVRVFASADVPHIVRGTGAVYVRSSKGNEPVDDHRTLLQLSRRGEQAEALARHRLAELSVVGYALEHVTRALLVAETLDAIDVYAAAGVGIGVLPTHEPAASSHPIRRPL